MKPPRPDVQSGTPYRAACRAAISPAAITTSATAISVGLQAVAVGTLAIARQLPVCRAPDSRCRIAGAGSGIARADALGRYLSDQHR